MTKMEYLLKSGLAEILKIDASGITACCKGKQKTSGKYIWKYKNEPDMAKLADELYEKLNNVNIDNKTN